MNFKYYRRRLVSELKTKLNEPINAFLRYKLYRIKNRGHNLKKFGNFYRIIV